jgi:hypothetical protein
MGGVEALHWGELETAWRLEFDIIYWSIIVRYGYWDV